MASAIKGSVTSASAKDFNKSSIKYEKLNLKPIRQKEKLAFLLRNVFTPAECEALIRISEDYGYKPALINVADGVDFSAPGYRDGDRVMIDDKEFADVLFQRISTFLPNNFSLHYDKPDWSLVEINERLRFLKYAVNGKFAQHTDGAYIREYGKCETFITLQIYLNGGFKGGETTFLERSLRAPKRVPVVPEPGMILVFQHDILHEGLVVKDGTKYTIRTDVLYHKP